MPRFNEALFDRMMRYFKENQPEIRQAAKKYRNNSWGDEEVGQRFADELDAPMFIDKDGRIVADVQGDGRFDYVANQLKDGRVQNTGYNVWMPQEASELAKNWNEFGARSHREDAKHAAAYIYNSPAYNRVKPLINENIRKGLDNGEISVRDAFNMAVNEHDKYLPYKQEMFMRQSPMTANEKAQALERAAEMGDIGFGPYRADKPNQFAPENTYDVAIPDWAMNYIYNGDPTGLTEEEVKAVDDFMNRMGKPILNLEETPSFATRNDINNLGTDVYYGKAYPTPGRRSMVNDARFKNANDYMQHVKNTPLGELPKTYIDWLKAQNR